jgi:hypothetical protein
MKKSTILWSVAVAGAFVGGLAVSAQVNSSKPKLDPLDAVVAAPKNHKVLYQDDHVRLLEVTVQPGETENMHVHQYPTVAALDAPQPGMRVRNADGTGVTLGENIALPDGPPPPNDLTPQYLGDLASQTKNGWKNGLPVASVGVERPAGPGGNRIAHQITNTGTYPHHFYRLEFLRIEGNDIMKKNKY